MSCCHSTPVILSCHTVTHLYVTMSYIYEFTNTMLIRYIIDNINVQRMIHTDTQRSTYTIILITKQ